MTQQKKTPGKAAGNGKRKSSTKKGTPPVRINPVVKPWNMSLEGWQCALRKQMAEREPLGVIPVDEKLCPGEYRVIDPNFRCYPDAMDFVVAHREAARPNDLISQGVSFLSGLVQTLSNPESTEKLVNTLVKEDPDTGQASVNIPVPDKKSVQQLFTLIGQLLKR